MIVYVLIHLICAFVSYGLLLAYAQREFPLVAEKERLEDVGTALALSLLFGPLGLIATVVTTRFGLKHGFLLWPEKPEKNPPSDSR